MDGVQNINKRFSLFKNVGHPVPINVKVRRKTTKKLAHMRHFVGFSFRDRYKILESRDFNLRQGIIKENNAKEAKQVVGFCFEMCPEKERYRRLYQTAVPIYEMGKFWQNDAEDNVDHVHMVKEYVRSSADQPEPLPHELRPPHILSLTMGYLIQNVIVREPHIKKHLSAWYDFLTNRMHAIRKDITQQMLCDATTASILEKCVRFYIYGTYRLRSLPRALFDQQLNLNELGHCLASLLVMYQDLKKCSETSPNQLEFFIYNMIYRMNDADMLGLVCRYDENLSDNPRVSFILQLHKYFQQGNYVQFFKAYKESATFLEACLLSRYVMEFRVSSVNAIRRAHRMHKTTVKISSVADWLCFDSDKEAEAFLAHFRVLPYPDQPDMVNFNPKDFQPKPDSLKAWWPKLNFVKTKLTKALVEIINGGPITSEAVLPAPYDSFDNYSRYTRDPVLDIYFGKKVVTYEQLHGHAPGERLSVHQSSSVDAMQYDDEEDDPPLPAFLKNISVIYEKDIPPRLVPLKESRSCFLGAAGDLKFRRNSILFGRGKARVLQYKRSSYVPQVKYPSSSVEDRRMHQRRGTLNNTRRGRAGLCRSNMANRGNTRPPYRGSNYRRNVSDRYHYFKSPTRAQPCLTYRMNRSGQRGMNFYRRGALKGTKRPMGLEIQENLLNNQQTYSAKNTLQNDVNNLKTVCTDNLLVKQKLQTEHVLQETVQYANAATTFGGQVFEKPLPTAAPANISVPQIGSSLFNAENLKQNVEGIQFETNREMIFPMTAIFNAAAETEPAEKRILSEAAIVDGTSGNDAQAMEQECLVESFAEECKQIQPAQLGITSEIFSTQVTTPSTAVTSSSNFASWIGFPMASVREETLGVNSQAEQTKTNSGTSFPTGGLFSVADSDGKLPFNAASAFVQTTEANSSTPWLNFSFANVTKRQEEAKEKEFQAEKGTSLTWGSLFDKNFGTESKMKDQQQQLFTISTTQGAELATAIDSSVPLIDFSSEAKRNATTDNSGKFGQEEKNIFFPVVSLSNYCEQMESVASEVTAVTETVLPAVAAPAVSWSGFLSSSVTTQQEEVQEMDSEAHKGTLFPGDHFANVQNFQMQPLQFAPSAVSFPNMATNTYASFANFSQSTTNSGVTANGPELQKGAFFSFGSHVVDEQKPLFGESFTSQIPETPTSTVANFQSSWINLMKNFERKTESPMEAEMIDLTGSDSSLQISEMAMPAVVEPAAPLDQPLPDEMEMSTDGSMEAQVEEEEGGGKEEEEEEEEEEVAEPMIETADSVVLERDVNAGPTNQATCIANWQTTTDFTDANFTPEQTNEQTTCPFSTELAAEMPSIVVPSIFFETTSTETAYDEPLQKQMKIVSADFAQHQSLPGRQLDDHHSAVADAAGILPSDHSLNLSDIFAQDHLLSRRSCDVSSEMLETESSMQRKMRCVGAYRRIRDLFLAKELMEIAVDNLISRTVDQVVSELCKETIGALKQMMICRCLADILDCSYLRNTVRDICHQVILEEQKKMEEISKNSKTKMIQLMRKYFEIWYSITKTSRTRKYFAALPLFDSVETTRISRGRRSTSLLSLIDADEDEASDRRSGCSDDTVTETKLNSSVLESWHGLDWPGLIRKWAAGSSGYKVSVNLKTRIRLLRCGLFVDPTLTATTREWIRLQFGLLAVRSKTWTLPPSGGNMDLLCLKNTLIREDASMSVIKHLDWLMIAWNASTSLAENHTIDISELCSTTRYLGLLVFVRLAKSDHYSENEIAKMLKLDVLVSTGCIAKYVVIMWPYENVFVGAKEKLQNAIELVIEGNVNFRSLNFRPIGQYICHYFSERYDKILWKWLKSMTRDEANEMHKDAVADIRCSAQVVDPREYVEEEFLKLLGYPMSCFCSPDDFYKLLDEIGAINLPSQSNSSNSMSITEAVQYFFTSITDRILVIRCTNFICVANE